MMIPCFLRAPYGLIEEEEEEEVVELSLAGQVSKFQVPRITFFLPTHTIQTPTHTPRGRADGEEGSKAE